LLRRQPPPNLAAPLRAQIENTRVLSRVFSFLYRGYKPDSVIRVYTLTDSYLPCLYVAIKIFAALSIKWSTALHVGRNFAVSPICLHMIIPEGTHCISALASLLASLRLLSTGVTRYPATEQVCTCPDFPHKSATVHHDKKDYTTYWLNSPPKLNTAGRYEISFNFIPSLMPCPSIKPTLVSST